MCSGQQTKIANPADLILVVHKNRTVVIDEIVREWSGVTCAEKVSANPHTEVTFFK